MPRGEPLFVVVAQPDSAVRDALAAALEHQGHEVLPLSAASWAVPRLQQELPDVVVVDRAAHGFDRLLDALDDLDVFVPVVVTRYGVAPRCARSDEMARDVLRQVELAGAE